MAKIDELKERLGILKFWLGIMVATMLAVAGWVITNFSKIHILLIGGSVLLLIVLMIGIFVINKAIDKKCKEIGEIE